MNNKENKVKIGVISPANSITGEKSKKMFSEGVKKLEEVGFDVIVGKNVFSDTYNGYCGSIEEKINDLYDIASKAKYIICSTGGINSNVLLSNIDYKKIENNIFIGNSNPTLLFNAFYEEAKVTSYIGPNVKSLGKMNNNFSLDCLKEKLIEDNKTIKTEKEIIIIKKGNAKGIAIGGNIQSLRRILGTKYFPKLKDYILYIEASPDETNMTEYESIISQLEQANILKYSKGIILGYYDDNIKFYKEIYNRYNVPIVVCNNLGHNINNNMLPIGKKIIINDDKIMEV